MSRVHLTFALLILALALPACSSESGAPARRANRLPPVSLRPRLRSTPPS